MEGKEKITIYDESVVGFYSKERQFADKIGSMMSSSDEVNSEQDSAISELKEKMEAQSGVDNAQDEKLASLEDINVGQDEKLTSLETVNSEQDSAISELKEKMEAQSGVDNAQDEKLASLEEGLASVITEEKVEKMISDASHEPYDDAELRILIGSKQDVGDYALKSEIPSLDGYATEEWVENKNYLTEHISLDEINAAIEELKSLQSKLETKTELLMRSSATIKVAAKTSDIEALNAQEKKDTNLVVSSQEVIESLTSAEPFNSLTIVDGATDKSIKVAAKELTINGMIINGDKDNGNGKINYSANTVEISNVEINSSNQNYNVFEGTQQNNEYRLDSLIASNIKVDDINLKHNVFNVYAPNDNCEIIIKDSYFNIDVHRTNVLRMSNYFNAENVSIVFDNVKWTYENADYSDLTDFKDYAGLVLFQSVGGDAAENGDYSHLKTWTIKFKDCYYGDEKLTEWNENEINQSLYVWGTKAKEVLNPSDVFGEIIYE